MLCIQAGMRILNINSKLRQPGRNNAVLIFRYNQSLFRQEKQTRTGRGSVHGQSSSDRSHKRIILSAKREKRMTQLFFNSVKPKLKPLEQSNTSYIIYTTVTDIK